MNLEQREMAFKKIMNWFIILLKPSPSMLNNLYFNAYINRVNPACHAIALALATAG